MALYKRGQILLMALVLLAGVFAVGMGLGLIFLREAVLSRQNMDSVRAIYAADTALEWRLYRCFKDKAADQPVMTNETEFQTELIKKSGDITLRAVGIARGVRRGLEVPFTLDCL